MAVSALSQSNHEMLLSWQYALLLPRWVRPISSPPSSIGTPWESSNVVRKLRICRARSATTSPSSVGPSTPQFHERLWLSPSRLASPFAALGLSLNDPTAVLVHPSWAVTKLIDAIGRRPSISYRSADPVKRDANSPRLPGT